MHDPTRNYNLRPRNKVPQKDKIVRVRQGRKVSALLKAYSGSILKKKLKPSEELPPAEVVCSHNPVSVGFTTPTKGPRNLTEKLTLTVNGVEEYYYSNQYTREMTPNSKSSRLAPFSPNTQASYQQKIEQSVTPLRENRSRVTKVSEQRRPSQNTLMHNISAEQAAICLGINDGGDWNWCHGLSHSQVGNVRGQVAENLYLGTSQVNALHEVLDSAVSGIAGVEKTVEADFEGSSKEERKLHFPKSLAFTYELNGNKISMTFDMQSRLRYPPELEEALKARVIEVLRGEQRSKLNP